MVRADAATRLARAAFELFTERGYDATTVDDIAARAGTGRTTFFRLYGTKEDVIFPDHDSLLELVRTRLSVSDEEDAVMAVCNAIRIVLTQYVRDEEMSRRRFDLTSTIPALRERELVSVARYQRLFREFLSARMGNTVDDALHAEIVASALVAAHNQVLRRWLRRQTQGDPLDELDHALRYVRETVKVRAPDGAEPVVLVVSVPANVSVGTVVEHVRKSLQETQSH